MVRGDARWSGRESGSARGAALACIGRRRSSPDLARNLNRWTALGGLGCGADVHSAARGLLRRRRMAKTDEPKAEGEAVAVEAADGPLLDLTDGAVKRMLKIAKKRGWVTHDELNAILPSEEISSDRIEDINSMLNEMGISVVDSEDAEEAEKEQPEAAEEEEPEAGELVEAPRSTAVATRSSEPAERTDDPVRMYLREMGSVELLSREGEIAIAKRIEAGREAMIAGLCESPLTFQAIIIWRDELNEGRALLRDIIDLDATYADPDAKISPFKPAGEHAGGEETVGDGTIGESNLDDEDDDEEKRSEERRVG